jgi:hypothetical protein
MLVGAWAPSFGTFGAGWLRLVALDTTRFTLFAAPPGLSLDLMHIDGLMGSSGDADEFPLLSRTARTGNRSGQISVYYQTKLDI